VLEAHTFTPFRIPLIHLLQRIPFPPRTKWEGRGRRFYFIISLTPTVIKGISFKTNLKFEIMGKTEHSCVPDIAQIDGNRKMEACRKRIREEVSVPVNKIFE